MKIIVGYPPLYSEKGTALLSQNRQFQYFNNPTFLYPVTLGTGATWLRDNGNTIIWKDCIAEGISKETFFAFLNQEQPDFFFFETKSPVIKQHWAIINELKKEFPNMQLGICGDHVSFKPRETMEHSKIDYVFNGGYYDFAMVELIEALQTKKEIPKGIWHRKNGKVVDHGRYNFTRSLDEAPYPDRVLTRNDLYQKEFNLKGRPLAYIMSGRDCWWGKCTFCFHPDTDIFTDHGMIPIKDMPHNTQILTHKGTLKEKEDFFENYYSGNMIELNIANIPKSIKCTPNHRFYGLKQGKILPEFITAEELSGGDYLLVPKQNFEHDVSKQYQAFLQKITSSKENIIEHEEGTFVKILSIGTEEYMGLVYNMQVAEEHSYTAGLVAASNCVWDHALYPKGTFRARTPENVLKEVKYLVDECGVKEIFDDAGTITVGPWLKKFCDLMINSGYNNKVMYSCNMRFGAVNAEEYKLMKKAGFRLLKYGLESGMQATIDKLDKGTKIEEVIPSCKAAKDAGLTVHLTMMVGYPWETKEDALATLQLARTLMHKGYADVLQSTVVIPYPGTPLYTEAIEKGWLLVDPEDYEKFDMTQPIFKTPYVAREEIMHICDGIYTKVFFHPAYVYQHLKKIRNWNDVVYTLRGVKAVIGHVKDFSRPIEAVPHAGR